MDKLSKSIIILVRLQIFGNINSQKIRQLKDRRGGSCIFRKRVLLIFFEEFNWQDSVAEKSKFMIFIPDPPLDRRLNLIEIS